MTGLVCSCGHCGHEWEYTGEKDAGLLTSCPTCGYKVRIET